VTCSLKIVERDAWIFAKEIRVGARAGQGCSEVDGFCDVRGHQAKYRLRVQNLNNGLDSNLGEASQLGIGNVQRTRLGIGRDTVDEEQNVPCPSNLEGRVVIGLLYKGKRRRDSAWWGAEWLVKAHRQEGKSLIVTSFPFLSCQFFTYTAVYVTIRASSTTQACLHSIASHNGCLFMVEARRC
jgi:hypothetical protein